MNKEELKELISKYIDDADCCFQLFEERIRLETLKEVLPEKREYKLLYEINTEDFMEGEGFQKCRQEIINKAKDKWNIKL